MYNMIQWDSPDKWYALQLWNNVGTMWVKIVDSAVMDIKAKQGDKKTKSNGSSTADHNCVISLSH